MHSEIPAVASGKVNCFIQTFPVIYGNHTNFVSFVSKNFEDG